MALQPQQVDVPFEGGLETRQDRRYVLPSKLLDLENAVFTGGTIHRRPGTISLPDTTTAGGALSDAKALMTRGGELLRWTDAGIYGLTGGPLPASQKWLPRGDATDAQPLGFSLEPVVARASTLACAGCASTAGISVYVWTEAPAGGTTRQLRATVIDEQTGVRHQEAVLLASGLGGDVWRFAPKVVATDTRIVVFYGYPGGVVIGRVLTASSPTTWGPEVVVGPFVTSKLGVTWPFEIDAVAVGGSHILLAYTYDASGTEAISLSRWKDDLSSADATNVLTGLGNNEAIKVGALADESYYFLLYRTRSDGLLRVRAFTSGLVQTGAYAFASPVSVAHQTLLEGSASSMTLWLETGGQVPILRGAFTPFGITTQLVEWGHQLRLAGEAFTLGARRLLPCLFVQRYGGQFGTVPGLQPTIFIVDADASLPRPVARALEAETGFLNGPGLPRPLPLSSGGVAVVVPDRQRLALEALNGVVFDVSALGLTRLVLSPLSPSTLPWLVENGALHHGGGLPAYYDGASWVEDGFNVYPEGLSASVLSYGDGHLSTGTYSWVAVYEWTDAMGRRHQSAPSAPVSLTLGTLNARVEITVPLLWLTRKQGVRIALYRTTSNGTVYYRVSLAADTYTQDFSIPIPDNALIQDKADDATVSSHELLYTTGLELEHLPPPAYSAIHQHQGSLFVVRMDDPLGCSLSLPLSDDANPSHQDGPAWSDLLTLRVPATSGHLVGAATMDDRLVLFTDEASYVVAGRPPGKTGADGTLTVPSYVTGGLGCTNQRSIVLMSDGVMHETASGLYLLTRSLDEVPLGTGVDRYQPRVIVRAMEFPARREVRFYTTAGNTLVYFVDWKQWAVWTQQPAVDAVLLKGVPHYATFAKVRQESSTLRTEDGASVPMKVGTSWLRYTSIQGAQRVWKAMLLGSSQTGLTVNADIFYDWVESAPLDTHTKTLATASEVLQLRLGPSKQVCQALRFVWTLTPAGDGDVSLTAMTLELGIRRGLAKLPASNNL